MRSELLAEGVECEDNSQVMVIFSPSIQVHVRVAAAKSLRAALTVTSQREAKQKSEWYRV